MKKALQKVGSTVMALLLLLSTISWTVEKHLCMGRVMDVAFFSHVDDCGMEAAMPAFDQTENHCCDSDRFTVEGQDDLKVNLNDLELDQQIFLCDFSATYYNLLSDVSEQSVPNETYPPPILIKDYTVLFEVYLI